ncbi:MAG TPA: diguanylate cyclase, partial [Cellvibrionaceae bacterium]
MSGILGAIRVGVSETDRLELLYNQRLITLSDRYSTHLNEELQTRLFMLQASRDVLSTELYNLRERDFNLNLDEHRQTDGSYRQIDYASGVFIHPDTLIDQPLQRQIVASRRVWDRLGPVFQEMFAAFYFISEQRLSRVWPSEIAVNHRADHDVTEDIFYTVATEANNPNREPRWTPAYRDSYSNQWLTTLVIPVYVEDEFIGVVGGDVEIAYLLSKLAMLDMDANHIEGFIYDPRNQQLLMNADFSAGADGSQAQAEQLLKNDLTQHMQNISAKARQSSSVERLTLANQHFNVITKPFVTTAWHLGFYYPQSLIESRFRESMTSVYINILVVAVFLFAVLFFSIRYFVIQRISALANATSAINRDNWIVSVPDRGHDEISQLGTSINNMLDHIRHLVRGLDAKIVELDKASYEARQLMSAIENSTSLVVILNKHWQLEYANSQYWQMTGLDEDQGHDGLTLLLLRQDNPENITLESIHNTLTTNGKPILDGEEAIQWQQEYHAQLKNGQKFWLMQTIAPIFGTNGELEYYVCVGQNISDLKEKQDEVEKLAYFDHLTGLANRLQFKTELIRQLSHCERNKSKLALFYLDLDHFKRINDTMGHEAGDILLKEIARRLRLCLRQEDGVARLGGDEFAVLLDNIEGPQYVYVVAQKIIRALNEPIMLNNKETVVGVSIGITIAPDDSGNVDTLMKNADLAMYRAK